MRKKKCIYIEFNNRCIRDKTQCTGDVVMIRQGTCVAGIQISFINTLGSLLMIGRVIIWESGKGEICSLRYISGVCDGKHYAITIMIAL